MLIPLFANAQCPWNRVNCAHGCGRHFDENGDGFCDYSIIDKSLLETKNENPKEQTHKEDNQKKDSIKSEKTNTSNNRKNIDSAKLIKPKKAVETTNNPLLQNDQITLEETTTTLIENHSDSLTQINSSPELQTPAQKSKPYDLLFISFLTIFLYTVSFILTKLSILRKIYHRRIWNFILLLTFIISCFFGFFMVIQINYNFVMDWFKTVLYWHVQIGIAMTLISIFHIFWHLKYFKRLFSKAPEK